MSRPKSNARDPLPDRDSPWNVPVIFKDRTDAAEQLTEKLKSYLGQNPLVLGIPRGSVPMAEIIAEKLEGELDVILVHKIGAPDNAEFAVGSVSEFGKIYPSLAADRYEVPIQYLEKEAQNEIKILIKRRKAYTPLRRPINPENRIVIIVDDGIATGATALAAVRAIRSQKPKRVIVASPVASISSLSTLEDEVDELVILATPEEFYAVGQFYQNFRQVEDEEVIQILSKTQHPPEFLEKN